MVVHVCSGDPARSCIGVSAKLAISRGRQCSMQGIYCNFHLFYRDKSFAAPNLLYQLSMARYCVIEAVIKDQLPSRAVPVRPWSVHVSNMHIFMSNFAPRTSFAAKLYPWFTPHAFRLFPIGSHSNDTLSSPRFFGGTSAGPAVRLNCPVREVVNMGRLDPFPVSFLPPSVQLHRTGQAFGESSPLSPKITSKLGAAFAWLQVG